MTSPRGYILTNYVSHSRFFPFLHTFKYTTLAVLVELSALENGELDIPLLFGYNKRWRALCALRPDGYLFDASSGSRLSFTEKLNALLGREGYGDIGQYEAWILTMPTYFGFAGINPLTVYFLYKSRDLALLVFEVHNTFGETHIYFMRPGICEDSLNSLKHIYDHRWTFPRAFHVSPFNDRKGFYTISVRLPSIPSDPKPAVIIQLREPADDASSPLPLGRTKLTASLRTVSALPLSPSAVKNIIVTFMMFPFSLFLSMPRILYQAWILHYGKGGAAEDESSDLKVYLRPEPFLPPPRTTPPSLFEDSQFQLIPTPGAGITTRRLPPGLLASNVREHMREFLRSRVQLEDGKLCVVLIEPEALGNKQEWFISSTGKKESEKILRITLLTSMFYELMLTAPSPGMALFAGGVVHDSKSTSKPTLYSTVLNVDRGPNDIIFVVNDARLFLDVFSCVPPTSFQTVDRSLSSMQRLRLSCLPTALVALIFSASDNDGKDGQDAESKTEILNRLLSIPSGHFLDFFPHGSSRVRQMLSNLQITSLLISLLALSALEPLIFALFRVRVKSGTETWGGKLWERVERRVRQARCL
ncbi:hypothetical protein GYMLUDRAFT_69140 [Collybiopsis luxurians FD-317 M1]|nr:hypothetical protein GYMLUDRAFT_69140 [Collybiopsis luxurians FD-317 M1]